MSLFRLLLRRTTSIATTTTTRLAASQTLIRHPTTAHSLTPLRTFAFSSAEEAAAERRRRKRRLRIEPPLHALRRDPSAPRPPPDPNAPRLPDSTSSLVGPRLNLHNRVQSLIRAGDLDSASALARQAVFSRTRPTVFTCNAIIAAMYRAKRYEDAVALFSFFFKQSNIVPNVVSYNFLIVAHCESGRVDEGLEVYRSIIANAPFSPSSVTYRYLTKGLIDAERIGEAMELLREMLSKGHGADSLVYNNLIKGFLDLKDLGKANELFDELKERCLVYDGVVNATFMDWFFDQGKEKEAMESYRGLLDRKFRMTPATCNVLLDCLLRHGREKDAWELFDTMLDNHTPPNFQAVNSDTFSTMVNECFRLGKFDEAVAAFRKVGVKTNSKPFSMDVAGYNNIIVRFSEHDMIEEAEKFFEELRSKSLSPDVTGYRTLIDAYLKEKRFDDALQMFHLMVDANLRVLPLYANRWLGELIENGKVIESSELLTKLGEKDPKPDVMTYELVIKGLCIEKAFDQCKEIISQMTGYGVGVTPTLREFIVEVFEKEGQKDEIEKLLDSRRRVSSPRSQPNGNTGVTRPNGFQLNASPRFPQSVVPSGSSMTTGQSGPAGSLNQFGLHNGSVGVQSGQMANPRYPAANGQVQNAGFARPYEFAGASASTGATGFAGTGVGHGGFTGSGQMVNAKDPAANGLSATQFSPSRYNENGRNEGAYEPQGSYAQTSMNDNSRYPVANGPAGYTGSSTQFTPSSYYENARNQGAYEPQGSYNQTGINENSRYPAANGPTQFAPPRFNENDRNQGAYEPQGSYTQTGTNENFRYPAANGPAGLSGSVGYTGSSTQFTGPSRYNNNGRNQGAYQPQAGGYSRNQGAYESTGFSAQFGSTRYPEPAQQGGQWSQPGHSQQGGQWSQPSHSQQVGQWSQPGHSQQGGQWSQPGHSQQGGQWSQPGHSEDDARYSQTDMDKRDTQNVMVQ